MPYQSRYMQEKFENANQEGEDRPYQSRFMKERFSNGAGVDTTDAHSEKQYQSNYMRERFKNGVDTYAKQEQEKQDQKTQQTPDNTPPENKSAAPEQPSSAERNQKRIEDELQAQRRESGLEAPVDTEDPGYFFKAANPDAEYSAAEPTQGGLAKYLGAKAVNGVKSGLEGLWNAGVGTLRIGQQNAIRDYYNEASPEEREKVFGSKTEDEAGQEYGGLYSDKYISGAKEKSAEIDKAYSDVSSTGAGKAMGEISSMIGNMAPNIALNLIAPGTGRLFAGVSAGGNAEKEARDNNASESSAYGYGILSAAANTTFDSLFGGIPGIGKGVVDDAVQRIAKSETGKRLIRSVVDTLGEGAEDYLTQVTDAYLRKMWNGDNKNAVETLIAAQPDAIYAGLMGSLMSAVMSAPSNISAIANAPKFDKTAKAAHAGESLTPEQIGHANAAAMPLDLVGSEDWYDINMAKYKGNSDVPSAVKPQTDAPNLPVDPSTNPQSANIPIVPAKGVDADNDGMYTRIGGDLNEPTGPKGIPGVFENTDQAGARVGSDNGPRGRNAGRNKVLYRVLENDDATVNALRRANSQYVELTDTTEQAETFSAALDNAIKANKHGLMVSPKTPQELADSGAITFMTKDGLAGAAVTADGDIEAVFKNPESHTRRASAPLMLSAIENGGRKLDCYGVRLVQAYNQYGFEPVARVAWNPEYAPNGWTYGPKDVYVMKLADNTDAASVKNRLGLDEASGGFHTWTQAELDALPEMEYDSALAYRDGLLEKATPDKLNLDVSGASLFPDVEKNGGKPVGRQAIEPYGPNTVGAAEANPNSFSHMQNEYGTIEPGENPARVVDVPKSTDGKDKVSLYARTLMEAKATPESLIPEYEQYVADGLFSHNVKTDKAAMDSAVRTIKDKGYSGALAQWSDVVEGRRSATKEDTTLAQLLYTEAAKAGDTKGAMRLAAEIAVEGTRAGQVEQSMRLLKKMTPEGNLYYVQKSVDRLQHDLATGASIGIGVDAKTLKAFKAGDKKLTIPEDLAANLLNAKNEKEITAASEAIWQSVGQQLPANWVEKWNAWRYFAMLGNARTHIRNIAGNAVFWPARQLKNMTGSVLETVFVHDTSQRTKAVLNPLAAADKERMSFAKSDFDDNMRSVMMGSGKLNPANVIRESRDTFRIKPLNALVKGNGKALDFEDAIFSGNAYADSMAGYMKARKLTAADMTGHTLEQARSYALDQAKKATYRDDSAIASAINKFSKKNAATQIIVGGAAPFTKTPINIVKRGIEYSPVGISKALTYDARKVMKNEMTASELIEDLSAGLTGTGIMALGTYFASKGILTGGNKENKKEEQFDELQGGQNYALKLGDKSYTIDWMAPVALPLFVGTELWNAYNKDGTASLTRVLDALTSISEPMVNLTMLQGINNAIKTAGYSKTPLTDIISSTAAGYFGQAVPTLGGQIARSIDNTRRTTFTQAGGPLAVESKTLQKLGNKIPGVSQKNAPFVDQWGRTQQNAEGNLAQRLAYNMLSPGFYSTNKSTQVDNVLNELYQKTGDQRALPKFANKTQTVGDEKNRYEKKLTKDEYTKFAQDSGKKAYDLLDVLVPGYKNLTDEQSVSATEKAYEVATDLAKNTALGSPLTQTTKNILDAANKYSKDENKNIGIAEIIKANVIIRDIRSDEYPNGKPISGSAKRKKVQALVDSGYSRADAMKLYDLLNN